MALINELRNRFERLSGEKNHIERGIDQINTQAKQTKRQIKVAEIAKDIVRTVALQTQSQLQYRISSTVSAAQAAVFDDPYELSVQFEEKRGRTECALQFVRDGSTIPPLAAAGYGAVDVAAFALRIAAWSMSGRVRPVLLLDEPFKHLKGAEQNRRVIAMMKEISKELGLQIITISDERAPKEDIIEGADKVFDTTLKDKMTVVQENGVFGP